MNTDINANNFKKQNKSDDNKITDKPSFHRLPPLTEKKSGNITIDNFIKKTRKNKSYNDKCLKWIDYEKFENLKQIGEGGFAKVYSATWLDRGKKLIYTDPVSKMKKIRTNPETVALKSIKGSNELSVEYLRELEIYHKLTLNNINDDAAKRIKEDFDIADKEIPNVQSLFKRNSGNSNFKYVSKQIDYGNVIKTSIYDDIESGLIELKLSDEYDDIDEIDENQ
ncbi:unnamed protein product [Rhizophagus irregularis]|nr:unnamed protein product [Rhizophagus irregularis]